MSELRAQLKEDGVEFAEADLARFSKAVQRLRDKDENTDAYGQSLSKQSPSKAAAAPRAGDSYPHGHVSGRR